jgi:cytochrome c oxidase subunit II
LRFTAIRGRSKNLSPTTHLSRFAFFIVVTLLATGCRVAPVTRNVPNVLDPRGYGAQQVAELWWIIFGLGTAVFVAVTALLLFVVYRRRVNENEVEPDLNEVSGTPWILWGGIIIPFIILMVTYGFSLRTLTSLAGPPQPTTVTIEVLGHRWWWEVRYPEYGIVTANEIVIPVGQPVEILLSSDNVIHSFWVPQLHGKLDMTPGRVDSMWLQADQPGVYRGLCAEFCGLQHSKMHFLVIAEEPDSFNAWLERRQQPAPEPADDLAFNGQQVFFSAGCVYCHTIDGTPATGRLGPNLTHLASRRTLAAAVLENNRGNLAGWIVDPQNIKPGSLMPPTPLDAADLHALLAYLESLE